MQTTSNFSTKLFKNFVRKSLTHVTLFLGGLVISWVANLEVDRIKHLSPFVKQEFARKSLPNYLRDMNEMITLFIDEQVAIPKYDAFGRYMTISVNGEHRNTNYVQRDFRVTYEVENSSGANST